MQNELTCPRCNQDYKDDNPPRLLTLCGHTYCEKCITFMLVPNDQIYVLLCLEGCKKMELQDKNIDFFPKNHALLKFIESKKNNSLSFKDQSFDVSKITKQDELQEDEDAKQLITAINEGKGQKEMENNISSACSKKQSSDEQIGEKEMIPEDSTQLISKQIQHKSTSTKQLVSPQKISEVQICLLHQKPLEVVCTIDMEKICMKCAIFGEHKGHDFKSLQEIDKKNEQLCTQIFKIVDQKTAISKRISNQTMEKQFISHLKTKTNKLKKEIAIKYKRVIDEIMKAEKIAYRALQDVAFEVEEKLKKITKVEDKINQKYDKWQEESFKLIEESLEHNFEAKMTLFTKGIKFVQEGKNCLGLFNETEQSIQNEVGKIINDIGYTVNENYLDPISKYIQIHKSLKQYDESQKKIFSIGSGILNTKNQKQNQGFLANKDYSSVDEDKKNQKALEDNDEESLLDLDEEEKNDRIATSRLIEDQFTKIELPKEQQRLSIVGSGKKQSAFVNKTAMKRKDKVNLPLTITKEKIELERTITKELNQSMVIQKQKKDNANLKKKIKSIKVPEKYQKILEGIANDSLECVDLTNAELGEVTIVQICQLIKNNSKIKTIKLIRNKLGDQSINKILPFLSSVITLNLSQNILTESVLSTICEAKSWLPQLKNVILSQTKISERKHKTLIDKLRKLDVTVSV